MPKASDYSKALIYKIEHLDKPDLIYVGSTTNLVKRKYNHKTNCNNEKSKKYNAKKYVMIRENGGWECFKMVVIKEYPCNTKNELQIEEEKCRKELQATLNSFRCHITEEERKEYFKEFKKKYKENEENHKKILETMKIYNFENKEKYKQRYLDNKEKILEQQKEYRENNRERINQKANETYQNNKEKAKEKMTCDCGSTFRISDKPRHEKSQKHQSFINRAD